MDNSTFFLTYILTLVACIALTIGIIILLKPGLKKYFENLAQDADIAKFFFKITTIILLLGGIGAGLTNVYRAGEKKNWLTMTWDIASHLQKSFERLFISLMIFAISFLILHLIARRVIK